MSRRFVKFDFKGDQFVPPLTRSGMIFVLKLQRKVKLERCTFVEGGDELRNDISGEMSGVCVTPSRGS